VRRPTTPEQSLRNDGAAPCPTTSTMATWTDKSDSRCRFFDGGESPNEREALDDLIACLQGNVFGKGTATEFDLLLFEVNCDTGRLLAAATTSEQHARGIVDGCSLRVQEVQDFWYDLVERGPTGEEFSAAIAQKDRNLGMAFRNRFTTQFEKLRRFCPSDGFTYRVFGSDPGVSVYEETFSPT
jgi:hypothetical protein